MARRNLTNQETASPDYYHDEHNPFNDETSFSGSESELLNSNQAIEMNNVNNHPNEIAGSNNRSNNNNDYLDFYSNSQSNLENPNNPSFTNFQNNVNNNVINTPITPNSPYNPRESLLGGAGGANNATDEYNRYPSIRSNRVTSMATSINSRSSFLNNNNNNRFTTHHDNLSSSSDGSSSGPFLVDADFSPFGGYPASSFPLHIDEKEPDDYLHNPDPLEEALYEKHRMCYDLKTLDRKSFWGLMGFIGLFIGAILVFVIYPVLTLTGALSKEPPETYIQLTRYTYPQLSAIRTSLVDPDTPTVAKTRVARDGSKWDLVFSDEFNKEGRTFYDGDDQFFVAPDIHYAATKDLEWYDPDASSTENGTLNLRMDAFKNHNLFYRSGMLQSWNRMCFTQGAFEVGIQLPNYGNVTGLWPGIWTMGNLGRPGYLASTEGVWPYSYEACDAGITPNQSSPDGISYLPGQKLNSCTCKNEDHPNRGVGRGAPEIDAIEGEMDTKLGVGVASQSLQLAPYDIWYYPDYNFVELYNDTISSMNTYTGGPFQQAFSATSTLNTKWYEFAINESSSQEFQKVGFEYLNDDENGYLQWFIGNDPTLTIHAKALHPNGNIDWRRLSKEPMSIILNLGISANWAYIDWPSIKFPVTFKIDYVRVYQPKDQVNVGCDPTDYPTYDYIQNHLNAYSNSNLTSWEAAGYSFPKNKLTGGCT